jgi:hypothetical protein
VQRKIVGHDRSRTCPEIGLNKRMISGIIVITHRRKDLKDYFSALYTPNDSLRAKFSLSRNLKSLYSIPSGSLYIQWPFGAFDRMLSVV